MPDGLQDKIVLVRKRALALGGQAPQGTAQTASALPVTRPQVRYDAAAQTAQIPHYNQPPQLINQQPPSAADAQQRAQQPMPNQPAAQPGFALPASVNRIAVLLPDQGALGKVGDEIYQGVKDAQGRYGANTLSKRYSVNKNNALQQYQQALADGADIVVGPLDKDSLAALLTQPQQLQTPILSLNYLNAGGSVPNTLYQFGLSPEDEARQIAEFALTRGQSNSVIMVPDSSWGERLAQAFGQTYRERGGVILHVERYPNASPSTYLQRVQSLLSQAQGASMVFLAASPTQARLLRPLLKDQAGSLPVYATSHIYSGRPASNADIDLDGIIYTEIPMLLNNPQATPDSLEFPRLYALGMDAVMIAKSLPQLADQSTLSGQTGRISMTPQRRIRRQLEFATFANGSPKALGN
ncbi:MAG: penicillin-binding protein activator [Thiolinea sp.]